MCRTPAGLGRNQGSGRLAELEKPGEETREIGDGKREEKRRERGDGKREEKESGEREELALDEEKGLVRDWSGKTMNAGGVENRIWTDCTGLAYELNSFASLTNCLANKQCFYFILGSNIFLY
ncbi:hypothetical protein TNCV_3167801 [Trichonephila clavipes]|uniref:Uncharacterized protein n=1 Tax=Trichonephila clavipes TaxID=2585209 RepID=A0A8X6RE90_TRICX|nr:hypothetical protein TNCV_3167801 [Trichonephila clavipes]